MNSYLAQSSITIKRLRNGDTIFLTLELNGKPLFQSVDEQTNTVIPDWSNAANQPTITPVASTSMGQTVYLSHHQWTYNGTQLSFTGAVNGVWTTDSSGKFALNTETGALKIINNLASVVNIASDIITYSCTATVLGVEYNLQKSIDIQIVKGAGSSYFGFIDASTTQLNVEHPEAVLQTILYLSSTPIEDYYVKWYKDNAEWVEMRGHKNVNISRSDIGGSQLFIAEFYLNSTAVDPVYRYAVCVIDTMDEIILVPYISSDNKEVDINRPVTVMARIVRTSNGSILTPSNPSWSFMIYDGVTWDLLNSNHNNSIEVNTTHTDQEDGSYHDIEVLVEVSFDSLT